MKIILSAHNSNYNKVNTSNTRELRHWLESRGYHFTPVCGVYKGKGETSFVVECKTPNHSREVIAIAWEFKQECVLSMLDDGSNCALVFPDNSRVNLEGTYQQITAMEAKELDAYTQIGRTYFAVV